MENQYEFKHDFETEFHKIYKKLKTKGEKNENKNKENNECLVCFSKSNTKSITKLECGHSLCIICCIKHFRKNENCPFCRKIICKHEDRTEEFEDIIHDEMTCEYYYENYNDKEMDMYDFLKFKGLNENDAEEIIDSCTDRCMEMLKNTQKYRESTEV